MKLHIYNTLTKQKEEFIPINTELVKMYSCGPTVYNYIHIGNMRSFLMSDILYRTLVLAGYTVDKVMNITDVGHMTSDTIADGEGEDKLLKAARIENKDPYAIARYYEDAFYKASEQCRIIPAKAYPRATEYIKEQLDMCLELIKKGYAYEVNGSVYYRVHAFKDYLCLSGQSLEGLNAGERIEINPEKEHPYDFALWKSVPDNYLMKFDSPFGIGTPGWHIECSAMSSALLGLPFDIHTGGEDNIFPHHECEIAQNAGVMGVTKTVNYWLHAKHLMVNGEKMSKSLGNFLTVQDVIDKGFTGTELRLALIKPHYRSTMNMTDDALLEARTNIKKIQNSYDTLKNELADVPTNMINSDIIALKDMYLEAVYDDLNLSKALAYVYEIIHYDGGNSDKYYFLEHYMNPIFDILEHKEIADDMRLWLDNKALERYNARINKDYTHADRVRDEVKDKGYELYDTPTETKWRAL